MSFRSVVISNSAHLSLRNNNLIISKGEEYIVPIEDMSVLVLEGVSINLTGRLLTKLSQNNVATVICDEKHLPESMIIPINTHYKSFKVLKRQLEQSAAFSKRIWQNIIKAKLSNQGKCLEILELEGVDFLRRLATNVDSGDKGNKEAIGAKAYFKYLYGDDFIRDRDNGTILNSALNYGYTIIRSAVARSLVAYGFNTALGVHHCNELNSFNLADDFVEPLRPIVDLWVYKNISGDEEELTRENRTQLIDLVNNNCYIDGQKHSILNAIDKMISSYTTAINKKDFRLLKLPEIIDLEYHFYE